MNKPQSCEVITRWHDDRLPETCGRLAVVRYRALGGGYMHLCAEHASPHEQYAERLESAQATNAVDPHAGSTGTPTTRDKNGSSL